MATVSALLCNYNHGRLVGRAIEALVAQSRPPDELIVVDDGSTDDSAAVIRSWAGRVPFLRFLQNEANLGFHASSVRALALAQGDYVYSGAADDYVLPGFFEAVVGLCERFPQAGIGCGQMVTEWPDGTRRRSDGYRRFTAPGYIPPERYLTDCLETEPPTQALSSSTIYRRQCLLEIGGWPAELGSWCDTFAIRAIGLKYGLCYVPQDVAVWCVNPGGLSQSTLVDPLKSLQIVRRAAAKMRSPVFAERFPAGYVQQWEAGTFDAIVRQQLQPAIDGHQEVQRLCSEAAQIASPWRRCMIETSRHALKVAYRMSFFVLKGMVARSLRRAEQVSTAR